MLRKSERFALSVRRDGGALSRGEYMQTAANVVPADFRALAMRVRESGLLDRRPGYYMLKVVLTMTAFGIGWTGLLFVGNSWAALGVAAFLGVTFTQLGFLGHDAGHQQICRSRRANRLLGLTVGNMLIGLSFGWWVSKHDAHHAHPNQVGRDPDIAHSLAIFGGEARSQAAVRSKPPSRTERWLFFPRMLLRSAGLHLAGISRLFRRRDRAAAVESVLLGVHFAAYLTALLWVLSAWKALSFIAVQQAVFSLYLGCSFAPNHKGMPVIDGDSGMSFAWRQVVTARNVTAGWGKTFLLGGLNYQIEHHLFPTMPRPNLARAQGIIRAFCIESGFGYREDSLVRSFRQAISRPLPAQVARTPPPVGAGRS
jgi:fatty acid desaturase